MFQNVLISLMADWAMLPIILLGTYALIFKIPKGHRFDAYKRILMAGLTAYLIAKIAGSIYQPSAQRPFEILGISAGASYLNNPGFPSDHVLFITAILCAVWFETRQKAISIILLILVSLVVIGRVLALVHTPTDVIGGIIIALIGAIWYIRTKKHPSN